jgi:enoyl-CoA hydratase/carnithine racemase
MEKLKYESSGSLGVITLIDTPLNLIGSDMVKGLEEAVCWAESNPLRGLLLKADEGNFSAGADVNMFIGLAPDRATEMLSGFLKLIRRIEALPYPTMAAVRGMCLAGGLELALAFDFIWATENATFGQLETSIGAIPFAGGAQRLAARVGTARAKEIVLGARLHSAAEFEKWNIVNRIIPEADLNSKAIKFMGRVAEAGATIALGYCKELINIFARSGLDAADDINNKRSTKVFDTEDLQLGVKSLLKNGPGKAVFRGR